jgi:hypothetical protein
MYDPPPDCKALFGICGKSVCQNVSGLLCETFASSLALMEIRARQSS